MEVNLTEIYPNPDQPRKIFNRYKLEELALSIQEQGLIEPLVVAERESTLGKYMLISGERRWRACQLAKIKSVPVHRKEVDDNQIAEMALVENIQRQDLSPLEEAKAFKKMLDSGYSKETLAQKMGFKQVWRVDERLALLNLSAKLQDALTYNVLTPSQAFELSRLDHREQEIVWRKIKDGELGSYNKLRRFVNAMVDAKRQICFFDKPKKEDVELFSRWQKTLDAVTGLICKSFSEKECRVLARVCDGNTQVNILKIDMIIKHLNLMKKAMIDNHSKQEVQQLCLEGVAH